jgi:hypothetical protein
LPNEIRTIVNSIGMGAAGTVPNLAVSPNDTNFFHELELFSPKTPQSNPFS